MEHLKHFYVWLGIGDDRPWEGIDYFGAVLVTVIFLLVLAMIIWGVYSLFNSVGAYWYQFSGTLEARQYEPSTRSTSVGFAGNSSGGISPVVMSSGSSESFDIFVRLPDKSIQKLYVDQQTYFDLKTGDTVIFWKKKGRLSKSWIDETTTKPSKISSN